MVFVIATYCEEPALDGQEYKGIHGCVSREKLAQRGSSPSYSKVTQKYSEPHTFAVLKRISRRTEFVNVIGPLNQGKKI
jgi:hypothetical protein